MDMPRYPASAGPMAAAKLAAQRPGYTSARNSLAAELERAEEALTAALDAQDERAARAARLRDLAYPNARRGDR